MLLKELVGGTRETIAGTVYGTIVALAALAAGANGNRHDLWHLAAIMAVTASVLWGAHVYSHGLGESLSRGRRLNVAELMSIARRESAIPAAAVAPVVAVALGAIGVFRDSTAIWVAFGVGVAALAVQGVRYARLERLSRGGAAASIALNLGLGLALVALEVAVGH